MITEEDLMVVLQASVARARAAHQAGYICKLCGGASPIGVGYADHSVGARERSAGVLVCGCGLSVVPQLMPLRCGCAEDRKCAGCHECVRHWHHDCGQCDCDGGEFPRCM